MGLKFSIPGFVWVGKCGKYSLVWLDLSRDFIFLGIQNSLKIHGSAPGVVPAYPGRVVLRIKYNPFWKFLRIGDSAWNCFAFISLNGHLLEVNP